MALVGNSTGFELAYFNFIYQYVTCKSRRMARLVLP